MMKTVIGALDEIREAIKGNKESELPEVSVEDAGKVLIVGDDGKWTVAFPETPSGDADPETPSDDVEGTT